LVEETGVSEENHRPVAIHWQTVSHNFVSSTPRLSGVQTHNVSGDETTSIIKALKTLRAGLTFESQCESREKKCVLEIRFKLCQQETSI
jgi:hypothetical protein